MLVLITNGMMCLQQVLIRWITIFVNTLSEETAELVGDSSLESVTRNMKSPGPGMTPGLCARMTPPLTPTGTWPRSQLMLYSCSWLVSFKPATEFGLEG